VAPSPQQMVAPPNVPQLGLKMTIAVQLLNVWLAVHQTQVLAGSSNRKANSSCASCCSLPVNWSLRVAMAEKAVSD
jgi:hypothetical protein